MSFPLATVQCGRAQVHVILAQTFGMDAGAVMGIVPRPLWEGVAGLPDAANRLPIGAVIVLVELAGRVILVDAHCGWKLDPKFAAIHAWNPLAPDWAHLLNPVGLGPESITDVLLSHLHFDHCGGATTGDPNHPLAFPTARHHVHRAQWEWARQPSARDRASYLAANLDPLAASDLLCLHDSDASVVKALTEGMNASDASSLDIRTTHGHTPGLLNLILKGEVTGSGCAPARGIRTAIDLLPTRAHLKPVWVFAFDHYPLVTVAEKEAALVESAREQWLVIGTHEGGRWPQEPWCAGFTLRRGRKGVELDESWFPRDVARLAEVADHSP
jgi:glyoxylase-like metal-dependent hydrolase (beta-lactamase superfamily II)